jgi:hypothetical protein
MKPFRDSLRARSAPLLASIFWWPGVCNAKRANPKLIRKPIGLNGKVASPERFELPTLCFEGAPCKTLSAASGVACKGTRHLSCS